MNQQQSAIPRELPVQVAMVSHAEVAEGSRRAGSASSRTSRSRHNSHHRGRSHPAGSIYAPKNEFPFFAQTGDVEIVIACDGQEKRYLLHRLILAQFSGFFEAGMSDEWSRNFARENQNGSSSRPDQALTVIGEESEVSQVPASTPVLNPAQINQNGPVRKRWRYELDWENLHDDEEPILVQKPPSPGGIFTSLSPPVPPQSRTKPPAQHTSFFRSVAHLSISSHHHPGSQSVAHLAAPPDSVVEYPLLRDYDNLFRIFYNFAPNLNNTNIAAAYSECKALLCIADMYDALPVVGPRIDHHLLRFSSRLFKQIAKYPPSYLKLGYLSRSRIIFSEALTHVVGQWPAAYPYLKPPDHSGGGYEIPQTVVDLIEDKVDELEEIKSKIEAKLFRLTLTTSRGERVNPTNDYLGWLAMSLWRQWLAENTTPEVRGILKNSPNPRPGSGNATNISTSNNTMTHQNRNNPRPSHPPPPAPSNTAPPNSSRIYRLISSTNSQSYLPREELKRFLKLYPTNSSSSSNTSSALYNRDNLRRFERAMEEIKNVARDIVKPLTRNCLELDLRILSSEGASGNGSAAGLGYLTCMRVEEGELPWD